MAPILIPTQLLGHKVPYEIPITAITNHQKTSAYNETNVFSHSPGGQSLKAMLLGQNQDVIWGSVPVVAQRIMTLTCIHEDTGLIPGLN